MRRLPKFGGCAKLVLAEWQILIELCAILEHLDGSDQLGCNHNRDRLFVVYCPNIAVECARRVLEGTATLRRGGRCISDGARDLIGYYNVS
jgi:hypothetical protein